MTPIFGAYLRMSWTRSFLIIFLELEISFNNLTFRDWEIQFQEKEKYVDQNWETHAQRTPIFGAYIYLRMCWTGSSPISFRDGFSDELHPTRFYWSAKSHRWGGLLCTWCILLTNPSGGSDRANFLRVWNKKTNIARGTTDPEIDSVTWTKFGNNMAPLA